MASGISLPLILFGSLALIILGLTIWMFIYDSRKSLIEKLFKIIREKSSKNLIAKEEADAAIGILYANNLKVGTPIYLFVNEDPLTDMLIISLLRAALRYFNSKVEVELDGPGIIKLPWNDRVSLGRMLQAEKTLENAIDFSPNTMIKKIDVLLTECSRASQAYSYLLKENGKALPKFNPLFFIAQKTPKDPRRILFPHLPE